MYDTSPIPIDPNCALCPLSNKSAVSGNGPANLSDIKLIVISDYPGAYETEFKFPQVPNDWAMAQRKQTPQFVKPNSGRFIRDVLAIEFGLTKDNIWFTNAVKCDPNHLGKNLTVTTGHVRKCVQHWLHSEFATINSYAPTAPILVAGSKALEAVRTVYPNINGSNIAELLRQVFYLDRHPAVCSYNPATYARSLAYIETDLRIDRRTHSKVITQRTLLNDFIYSPVHVFIADIAPLRQFFN
jgi:Uracil DNA glycosylase superfamily